MPFPGAAEPAGNNGSGWASEESLARQEGTGEPGVWDGIRPGVLVRPRVRNRAWLHATLLALTVLTTTVAGMLHYLSFVEDFGARQVAFAPSALFVRGLWYSATILLILGAHEMGHYLACRYYAIDASLPYFIPVPPIVMTGTLGAFIRIRQPIHTKRMLFDIGIAGPIAGFVLAVPALFVGLWMSNVVKLPGSFSGFELGEPLLFKIASRLIWGNVPDGFSVNLHPMAFAAWFGMLATALNLFPIGQLDGGHISYTVLGRRSTLVTVVMIGVAIALTFLSMSWLVWTILMVVMLFAFGAQHPPTLDDEVPLNRARLWLAAFALLMFVLCFTPAPIQPLDLIRH